MERVNTALILAETVRQLGRIAAQRRAGPAPAGGVPSRSPSPALTAVLPVVRGLAAVRLLVGRPGQLERALLSALVAGAGAAISAYPALAGPLGPEPDEPEPAPAFGPGVPEPAGLTA
jgi:hypothetical protein